MYHKKTHIHFMGIGGIGMSGIAKILTSQGYTISGCDVDLEQDTVKELMAMGCVISAGHNSYACLDKSIDTLVYSSAVKHEHPEIIRAQERGIPVIPRALMLAELMRTKFSIAIAGAHGKTTTTSMVSHILLSAGRNPTVIVGGKLKNIATNAQAGTGDFLVAEADESDRSFLHLQATIAVITNIDLEHLETYRDLSDITATFKQFLNNLPFYGKAFLCTDDPVVRSLLPITHLKVVTYSLTDDAHVYARDIVMREDGSSFDVVVKGQLLGHIDINMPGRHNILNALAAIAVALDLEITFGAVVQAFASFGGIERRFSYHGRYRGAEIFDDYGHHPKEIFNILLVARKRAKRRLHVMFQPHRFTRTHFLWNDFIQTFLASNVDSLAITDIYPASETPIDGVTSKRLVNEMISYNPHFAVNYIPFDNELTYLHKHIDTIAQEDDLVLILGAGKIYSLIGKLK